MYDISDLNLKSNSELFNLFCLHFYGTDVHLTRAQLIERLLEVE